MSSNDKTHNLADKDGQFRRQASAFRNYISSDPSSPFPAEANRYALYVHLGCPWAHRTNIVRSLKGLEDVIQLVVLDDAEHDGGKMLWCFSGEKRDPLYGFKYLKQLYEKSEKGYDGRYLVPTLWDKKSGNIHLTLDSGWHTPEIPCTARAKTLTEKIVSNESSEIIRMFYTEFDAFIPEHLREDTKGEKGIFPTHLQSDIEAMNDWVYNNFNNGVYKTGFATSQVAYEENVSSVFQSLDRLEEHLNEPNHQPYLFGDHITEADIRLFPTAVRFDVAYFTIFKCNLKMIRYEYPQIHKWLRTLYWDEGEKTNGGAFKKTVAFGEYKTGYARALKLAIVPVGPVPDILSL